MMVIYLTGVFVFIVLAGWKSHFILNQFDGDHSMAVFTCGFNILLWPVALAAVLVVLLAYIPFKLGQNIPYFITKFKARRGINKALKESK